MQYIHHILIEIKRHLLSTETKRHRETEGAEGSWKTTGAEPTCEDRGRAGIAARVGAAQVMIVAPIHILVNALYMKRDSRFTTIVVEIFRYNDVKYLMGLKLATFLFASREIHSRIFKYGGLQITLCKRETNSNVAISTKHTYNTSQS